MIEPVGATWFGRYWDYQLGIYPGRIAPSRRMTFERGLPPRDSVILSPAALRLLDQAERLRLMKDENTYQEPK